MPRALLALAAAFLLAGCGGDDAAPDSGAGPQDAAATQAARDAVTEMEACYVDAQDYRRCDPQPPAQVVEAGRGSYTLVSPSDSGTDFVFEKLDDGTTERTCSPAGEGGCSADGAW